nr:prolipoprotein diacylglyceryl transferase family protein [Desulfospira joergensenii]
MESVFFVLGLGLFLGLVLCWGFRNLPEERWQMVAALPRKKREHGSWQGLNLTWYGLLSANAYAFSVVILLVLAVSAGIPLAALVILTALFLAVTVPSSRIVAGMVEKKKATLTVGGAVFVGTVIAPWLILLINQTLGRYMDFSISVPVLLAAISIAYTFGESLGRLACLSFGCCYGKPLKECSGLTRRLFSRFYIVFTGKTKKISYASGLDGERMIPIQMITSVIYGVSALAGTWLFLEGFPRAALMETLFVTQIWRVGSEFFRADFRGELKFSIYQIMALATIAYGSMVVWIFPQSPLSTDLGLGLKALWNPGILLFVQTVWGIGFFHSGRSSVTDSKIFFNVVRDKI